MATNEELIKQMYDSSLASGKAQLQQSYQKADSEYAAAKEQNAKVTDANLTRTAVEGQKAAMNMAQLHTAQGLSSGTRAQARLSLENQTMANMTALRAAQQQSDADIERQRALLAQDYASAIAKAQADNDLQKAQALYEQAKSEEDRLIKNKLSVAKMMAETGDYSMYKELGLMTDEQVQKLTGAYWGKNGGKVPDGYTVTNITGNGYVVIGNSKIPTADLNEALASEQIVMKFDHVNKKVTYEYAHPGLTGDGAPIGETNGVAGVPSPNMNPDGTYTVNGRPMTVEELRDGVANGTIQWTYNNLTGQITYSLRRFNGAGAGGRTADVQWNIKGD